MFSQRGSHIRVLPDEFLLKSVVISVDFKRNSSGRTRIYEYTPPLPINALVSALNVRLQKSHSSKSMKESEDESMSVAEILISLAD